MIDSFYREMALRKLCKDAKKRPLKALFYFPDENLTGIAPTRLIVEKDSDLTEGMNVKVNWQGKRVHAEILALNVLCLIGIYSNNLINVLRVHVIHTLY